MALIFLKLCFILVLNCVCYCESLLKTVQDDDVMNLIKSETYVIVLFSTKDCEICDNFENVLTGSQEELTKTFNGPIVKVLNSQLSRLYTSTKEPAVVFFRHGIPLLYHGLPNEELIIHTFLNNKEPVVKELTDETFEHLTQAASGATTGDWFVMFYTSDCVDCHRMQARWEAVGAQLKSRMNVARVNKGGNGAATAARFQVTQIPSFILFRHGKMYRYQIQKYDIPSFVSFAQDWYKNMKPERVPVPKSPFDEVVDNIVVIIRENIQFWQIILFSSVIIGFSLSILLRYKNATGTPKPKPSKKKDKGDKDK